eukprot:436709-Amphidinium_carterae.1
MLDKCLMAKASDTSSLYVAQFNSHLHYANEVSCRCRLYRSQTHWTVLSHRDCNSQGQTKFQVMRNTHHFKVT